jgi:DNA-binding CsgD family transcriptional regulator
MSGAMALGICLQELHAALRAPPIVPGPDVARPVRDMQHAVLEGVMRGWADKQIARALGLSRHTVDYHLRRLRHRFGVQNRVQLAQEAWLHEHRSSVSRWAATGEGDTDGETGRTIPTDLSEPA